MERVDMQVAIELGASVQPFTNMTPRVRIEVKINAGYVPSALK
jgi:hypothetical protein